MAYILPHHIRDSAIQPNILVFLLPDIGIFTLNAIETKKKNFIIAKVQLLPPNKFRSVFLSNDLGKSNNMPLSFFFFLTDSELKMSVCSFVIQHY